MGGPTPKGTVRGPAIDTEARGVEHPDEMIHIVRSSGGEIMDAGIEDFVELERMTPKYLKLTLTGRDETRPVVLVIQSEARITVREFGGREG